MDNGDDIAGHRVPGPRRAKRRAGPIARFKLGPIRPLSPGPMVTGPCYIAPCFDIVIAPEKSGDIPKRGRNIWKPGELVPRN